MKSSESVTLNDRLNRLMTSYCSYCKRELTAECETYNCEVGRKAVEVVFRQWRSPSKRFQ